MDNKEHLLDFKLLVDRGIKILENLPINDRIEAINYTLSSITTKFPESHQQIKCNFYEKLINNDGGSGVVEVFHNDDENLWNKNDQYKKIRNEQQQQKHEISSILDTKIINTVKTNNKPTATITDLNQNFEKILCKEEICIDDDKLQSIKLYQSPSSSSNCGNELARATDSTVINNSYFDGSNFGTKNNDIVLQKITIYKQDENERKEQEEVEKEEMMMISNNKRSRDDDENLPIVYKKNRNDSMHWLQQNRSNVQNFTFYTITNNRFFIRFMHTDENFNCKSFYQQLKLLLEEFANSDYRHHKKPFLKKLFNKLVLSGAIPGLSPPPKIQSTTERDSSSLSLSIIETPTIILPEPEQKNAIIPMGLQEVQFNRNGVLCKMYLNNVTLTQNTYPKDEIVEEIEEEKEENGFNKDNHHHQLNQYDKIDIQTMTTTTTPMTSASTSSEPINSTNSSLSSPINSIVAIPMSKDKGGKIKSLPPPSLSATSSSSSSSSSLSPPLPSSYPMTTTTTPPPVITDINTQNKNKQTQQQQHQLQQQQQPTYDCLLCPKTYRKRKSLIDHYKVHPGHCHDCGKPNGETLKDIIEHNRVYHLKEFPFICEICGESYSRRQQFTAHVDAHRKRELKSFSCGECGMGFSRKKNHRQHLDETGHKPEGAICEVCGASFNSKNALAQHVNRTHKKADNSFECHICQNKFSLKANLERHVQLHTEVKRTFVCDHCGSSYFTYQALRDHFNNAHIDVSECKCTLCGKIFSSARSLQRHLPSHSEERPHCCPLCPQTFKWKTHLVRHKQVVHGGGSAAAKSKKLKRNSKTDEDLIPGNTDIASPAKVPRKSNNKPKQQTTIGTNQSSQITVPVPVQVSTSTPQQTSCTPQQQQQLQSQQQVPPSSPIQSQIQQQHIQSQQQQQPPPSTTHNTINIIKSPQESQTIVATAVTVPATVGFQYTTDSIIGGMHTTSTPPSASTDPNTAAANIMINMNTYNHHGADANGSVVGSGNCSTGYRFAPPPNSIYTTPSQRMQSLQHSVSVAEQQQNIIKYETGYQQPQAEAVTVHHQPQQQPPPQQSQHHQPSTLIPPPPISSSAVAATASLAHHHHHHHHHQPLPPPQSQTPTAHHPQQTQQHQQQPPPPSPQQQQQPPPPPQQQYSCASMSNNNWHHNLNFSAPTTSAIPISQAMDVTKDTNKYYSVIDMNSTDFIGLPMNVATGKQESVINTGLLNFQQSVWPPSNQQLTFNNGNVEQHNYNNIGSILTNLELIGNNSAMDFNNFEILNDQTTPASTATPTSGHHIQHHNPYIHHHHHQQQQQHHQPQQPQHHQPQQQQQHHQPQQQQQHHQPQQPHHHQHHQDIDPNSATSLNQHHHQHQHHHHSIISYDYQNQQQNHTITDISNPITTQLRDQQEQQKSAAAAAATYHHHQQQQYHPHPHPHSHPGPPPPPSPHPHAQSAGSYEHHSGGGPGGSTANVYNQNGDNKTLLPSLTDYMQQHQQQMQRTATDVNIVYYPVKDEM